MDEHALRLKAGDPIRIDGRLFIAGAITDGGRLFTEKSTGTQALYSNPAQIRMAREGRISTEAMWLALNDGVREALATDWDAMLPSERETAQFRHRFVRRVLELPANRRHRKASVQTAIDAAWAENSEGDDKPTVRAVKDWLTTYLAAGKDIRALTTLAFRKGRGAQLAGWVVEEINKAIDQFYATMPPGSMAETRNRAITLIRARAEREGRDLPPRSNGQVDVIGINAVARVLKHRDKYEIDVARYGRAEADRIMEAVGEGPQALYPLEAVEIDHTLLDVVLIDEKHKAILPRPWLTVLLDRYSRCILGFCISFHPPSWTTVMEALRHAVSDKAEFLAEVGGIRGDWPCRGTPDLLVCDNGRDFHSKSMEETEAALNMRILYLPRKKGWLKGKIERWFRTLEEKVFHTIPGTTLSNVVARGDYDSEEHAVMTLGQARWIITKWIVDVYHVTQHGKTREAPIDRWNKGMLACGEKLPPPQGLLVPLMGLVVPGTLTREGIKFRELRWNSNAFSLLRTKLGDTTNVLVRIDPFDLDKAYVLDESARCWVVGDKIKDAGSDGLTLHQWDVVRKRTREILQPGEDRLEANARARGELFDYVQEIISGNKKSKANKRFARFYADGRKPHEHVAPSVIDPVKSARPLGEHDLPLRQPAPLPMVEPLDDTDVEPLTVRRRS